jgi:crossover junction endodeoxyribonuclease RuvC
VVRILGIDPGSRNCGYAVLDVEKAGRELRYVECGVLQASAKLPVEKRLGEIARGLREVVEELAPEVAAVEDVFSAANVRAALMLGQARGAALAVVGGAGLAVHAYPPATVKKSVTGRGGAPKDQVAQMVRALLGLRRVPAADAADALAVAITHAHHAGNS